MTRGASTEAIHRAEGASRTADPLTTPIYQTTTFLFESADEVRAYMEGRSDKFLYSRYRNPTVQSAEAKLASPVCRAAIPFSRKNSVAERGSP